MAELPITQDALDVAEATMYTLKGKPRSVVAEATIRSFLQAEGFKVDRLPSCPCAGRIPEQGT